MENNKKPSEVMQEFLDFLDCCQKECETARTEVAKEDAKKQDFLHALEFEENCKERSKIATQIHLSRNRRRAAKDKVQEFEKVVAFATTERNKPFLKAMRGLIREQKTVENYLYNERIYKPRAGDGSVNEIQSKNNTKD